MMSLLNSVFLILCFGFYIGAAAVEVSDGKVCVTAQHKFIEKNTEFERCTMQYAVDNGFCMRCLPLYVEQFQAYCVLLSTRDPLANNQNKLCGDEVNEKDHFDILQTHYIRSKDIWNKARCTKCFNCDPENIRINSNITILCPIKSGTLNLLNSTSLAQDCFISAKGDICKNCTNQFDIMMAKYKVEKSTTGNDMCFDAKNAVDRTRQMWHNDGCDPKTSSELSFTSILLLFLATGAIAYGSVRSYKVYRFRRDYLTTALANSENSSNYRLLEERNNDAEL